MQEKNYTFLPIGEIAKELNLNRDDIYYFFNTHKEDAKLYLKAKTSTSASGNTVKRYYVRNDFISHYRQNRDKKCKEDLVGTFEELYYQYVEKEEEALSVSGKSIATNEALWKDMEIIDAKLLRSCLQFYKDKVGRKLAPQERKNFKNLIYNHLCIKQVYLDACLEILKKELDNA